MSENRVFLQKYIIYRLKKIRVRACQGHLLRLRRLPCMLSFFYTLIIISNNISISFYGYRTKSISLYREENKKRAIPMDFTIFNKIHVSITKKISKKWQNIGSLQPNYRRILWKIYVRERSDRSFLLDYVFIMRSTGVERPFFFT